MPRLVNRNSQIPGGLRFYLPNTKWQSRANMSFQGIVDGLFNHLQANPQVLAQMGWPLDRDFISTKVDEYNAAICLKMGWGQFITEEGGGRRSNPFPVQGAPMPQARTFQQSAGAVVAGVSTIADMFGPEGTVTPALAEARAAVCVNCPKHDDRSSWTDLFTEPAANAIRYGLGILKEQNLKTSQEAKLHFCTACDCPMKLKVWASLKFILSHMPKESKAALHPECWILKESA